MKYFAVYVVQGGIGTLIASLAIDPALPKFEESFQAFSRCAQNYVAHIGFKVRAYVMENSVPTCPPETQLGLLDNVMPSVLMKRYEMAADTISRIKEKEVIGLYFKAFVVINKGTPQYLAEVVSQQYYRKQYE